MKAQLIKVLWALDFGRKRVGLNFAGPTTYGHLKLPHLN